ncbi:MAG TPA: crosslink repair DNA glycosylase YcaQ family protein [Actinomycetota bacterium]|nr:crosslink repair DNA glycosylase YcaQ family protein [Actinomycetota bacterium]
MKAPTDARIARFRLRRQHLDRRSPKRDLVWVVGEVGGLHAQLTSSAELAAWARLKGVRPDDVRRALWEDRTRRSPRP